jgi:integrase
VIVQPAKGNGNPKFASAHDFRRSCAERLINSDVPEREVAKILRHADVETTRRFYAPGTVQQSAGIIREKLSVPRNSDATKSSKEIAASNTSS